MKRSVDFVIPWVDANDPVWRRNLAMYKGTRSGEAHEARFRDWGTLRYWFRGIEQFAPWVNRIHFITQGHLPPWLNTLHPKLHIVSHASYIPKRYLPTFNSHTIELNLHRIDSLSNKYVYFNDDTFLIQPVTQEFFFRHELPCDEAAMNVLSGGPFQHVLLEDIWVLKRYLANKHRAITSRPWKWIHPSYGRYALYNIFLAAISKHYTGFINFHLPQPSRKNTLTHLWQIAYTELDASCQCTFRNHLTVNQYVQRYWELATNQFYPVNMKRRGRSFELSISDIETAADFIRQRTMPLVCVNDYEFLKDFDNAKKLISTAFNHILPTRSSFELF